MEARIDVDETDVVKRGARPGGRGHGGRLPRLDSPRGRHRGRQLRQAGPRRGRGASADFEWRCASMARSPSQARSLGYGRHRHGPARQRARGVDRRRSSSRIPRRGAACESAGAGSGPPPATRRQGLARRNRQACSRETTASSSLRRAGSFRPVAVGITGERHFGSGAACPRAPRCGGPFKTLRELHAGDRGQAREGRQEEKAE